MEEPKPEGKSVLGQTKINYYVVVGIVVLIFFYQLANYLQPVIITQLDFFGLTYILSYAAPAILSFIIARRYRGSKIFAKAYLALGAGYACQTIGETLFSVFQVAYHVSNPYPYYPDIFFSSFYILALFHLRRNSHYFKPKLEINQKIILILIPAGVTAIWIFVMLVPSSVPGSVPDLLSNEVTIGRNTFMVVKSNGLSTTQHVTVGNSTYDLIPVDTSAGPPYPQIHDPNVKLNLIPIITHFSVGQIQKRDQVFWNGFFMGLYYVAATSLVSAWAVVGFQIFRGTILGSAWGLLLMGLILNSVGDITYVYSSIYYWDRSSISTPLWVIGSIIVAYALFKHRKSL